MKIFLKDLKERFPEFEIKNYDESAFFTGFTYDSRDVSQRDIFIPIIGEKFDGHSFICEALESGCSMALCENKRYSSIEGVNKPLIFVDSIQEGLKKVLNYSIGYIKKPIVAISGSTGKSTTRGMLVSILKNHMKVLSSERYNTVWGNAVLLGKYVDEDVIVLECGMDTKGEMAWHVNSVDPDYGILLNIGEVHAEKLGSINEIFKEKKDLADYMEKTGKPLILNIDDERLQHIANNYNKSAELVTFGKKENAQFQISNISVDNEGTHFTFKYYDDNIVDVDLSVYGEGYAYDAMAAIIVANELGVSIDNCVRDIQYYEGQEARFQKLEFGNVTLINDAYNANPESMKMSINTFRKLFPKEYYTIAVLGEMKELGSISKQRHRELGEHASQMEFNEVYFVGDYFSEFKIGEHLESADEVAALLNSKLQGLRNRKVAILLKGSHALGLYLIPDFLKKLGMIN